MVCKMSFQARQWKIAQILVAALLAVFGLQATTAISYGQIQGWTQPVQLTSADSFGWFPDVAADATGQVHVAWSSGLGGYDTVMYTTSQNGREWSDVSDIMAMTSGGEVTRPALLADRQGILHLSFRETAVYYSQAPIETAYSAGAWLAPNPMSESQVAYFSRLAVDGKGKLHLVFTENVASPECPICYHVFYRQSTDNGLTWSAPLDISDIPTGSAKPQILIDRQDNIHVVWEAGRGGSYGQLVDPTQVMYAASYDGGNTWSAPVELGASNDRTKDIAIGLDSRDQLMVAWLGLPEDVVYYQFSRNQGRSWSSPQPIPGVWGTWTLYQARLDDYAMAADSAGDVHLVLVGRTAQDQKTFSVLHLTWDGSTWAGPEAITTLIGDVPEWPRIAVGRGNQLHVVWFVRDQAHIFDSENGKYRVWYAQGLSAAPAATPAVWPTSTLTPNPIASAAPTITPTPLPKVNPGQAHVSIDTLYTETDNVMLLVKGLLPAVLLVAAIVVGLWFRRH